MEHTHSGRATGCPAKTDAGPQPCAASIARLAQQNTAFRATVWTGDQLQMTVMQIPVGEEIGVEMHPDTDQLLRVEAGHALFRTGPCRERLNIQRQLGTGDAVFVPGGTWHNLVNNGACPLKLSSVYAPPNHPRGTVHRTRAEADAAEHQPQLPEHR